MTHTPGKWRTNGFTVEADDRELNHDGIPYTIVLAHAYSGNENDISISEGKANAHLMAAAPDLLAALEQIVFEYQLDQSVIPDYVEAAIAKAKEG